MNEIKITSEERESLYLEATNWLVVVLYLDRKS